MNILKLYNPQGRLLYSASHVPRFSPYAAQLMLNLAIQDEKRPIAVYDPFVGNGVILSVAQLNFSGSIAELHGFDVVQERAETTRRNMKLLTDPALLEQRLKELTERYPEDILLKEHAARFKDHLSKRDLIPYSVLQANALSLAYPESSHKRVVVTDPPYGHSSSWVSADNLEISESQLEKFLITVLDENIRKMVLAFDNRQPLAGFLRKYFVIKQEKHKKKRIIYLAYSK